MQRVRLWAGQRLVLDGAAALQHSFGLDPGVGCDTGKKMPVKHWHWGLV